MQEIFFRVWNNLIARTEGPMKLRFVVQPLVACFFAVRAGIRDARDAKPPFFWALVFYRETLSSLLFQIWRDVGKVIIIAFIIDIIYQIIELHTVYIGEAIIVVIILSVLPYIIVRGPVTRLFQKRKEPARGHS